MSFLIRKLSASQLLGEELKTLRKSLGLTIREMEEKSKIRKSFLLAFESDSVCDLPDTLYARNYLRTYLKILGVTDPEYYLKRWEDLRGTCDVLAHSRMPRKRFVGTRFVLTGRLLKQLSIGCILLLVASYIGFEVHSITAPPELVINDPIDGISTADGTIIVTGETTPGTEVKINGVIVLLNPDGSFALPITLERGTNMIEVEGAKRYSRPKKEFRRVVLEAKQNTALLQNRLQTLP